MVQRVGQDTNVQIRQGKDLLGVFCDVDLTDVVTRIMPTGEDKNGDTLYLPEMYIDSPLIGNYPHPKWITLPVSEAREKADGDDRRTKAQCYAIMRREAQAQFDAGCDQPKVTLNVDFVNCADTEEYRQYAFLRNIFLGDTVRVTAPRVRIRVCMRMTQYTFDCLTGRYTAITLGSVDDTLEGSVVSARQLPSGLITSSKLAHDSVGSAQLQERCVDGCHIRLETIGSEHVASLSADKILLESNQSLQAVAGKFYVDAQGNVHVVNGSGLYLGTGNASLAVYKQGDITAGFLVDTINGGTATITGNKVNIDANSSFSSVVSSVSTLRGEMDTVTGSALWQDRGQITGVVGKFTIDSSGNVHVIDGSNLYLGTGSASLGVYTDSTLTAGIIVDKINSGTVTITGNKVDISANSSFSSVVSSVGTLRGEMDTVTGSALWQDRSQITGVVGKFTIDSSGNVHIIDGSNLYLGTGSASLGVYTDSTLTAGIIVDKINNGTVTITGNKVNLAANSSFSSVVSSVGTLRGEMDTVTGSALWQDRSQITGVVGKFSIDSSGNVHVIDGSNLYLGTGSASLGVYTDSTLTVGIIVDKINNGTVTITGSKINLTSNSSFSSVVSSVGTLRGEMDTVTGSALWQDRSQITGAVGKFTIDNSGNLHVVDGSGFYLGTGSASLAVYKQGDITAGFIADAINGGTATIQGNHINLEANSSFTSKVSAGDIASTINQTAQEVLISASKINLQGYVTASELSATNASITNLTSGSAKATSLWSAAVRVDRLTVSSAVTLDSGVSLTVPGSFAIGSESVVSRTIYMTNVIAAGPTKIYGTTSTAIDLTHHHAITIEEGTGSNAGKIIITVGTTVATSSGDNTGNFSIAATRAYQDGVAAASNAVTVTSATVGDWNNGTKTVTLSNGKTSSVSLVAADFTDWSVSEHANFSTNHTYVCSFKVGGHSYSDSVDASTAYTGGYTAGWGAARGKVSIPTSAGTSNNISVGYPTATVDGTAGSQAYYITADTTLTDSAAYAYLRAGSTTGTVVARVSIKALYTAGSTAGANGVTVSSTGSWSSGSRTITLSNGKTTTVSLVNGDLSDWSVSEHANFATNHTYVCSFKVGGHSYSGSADAGTAYSGGYTAGWGAARGKVSIPTSAGTSNNISVGYPTATVDGTAGSQKYYMTADSDLSNSAAYAYLRAGSTSGTVVARVSTKSLYNKGYSRGWSTARGKIAYDSSTGYIVGPSATSGASAGVNFYKYTASTYTASTYTASTYTASSYTAPSYTASSYTAPSYTASQYTKETTTKYAATTAYLAKSMANAVNNESLYHYVNGVLEYCGKYQAANYTVVKQSDSGTWYKLETASSYTASSYTPPSYTASSYTAPTYTASKYTASKYTASTYTASSLTSV